MSTSIKLCNRTFTLTLFGSDFILLRCDDNKSVFPIGEAIYEQHFSFLEEVIATESEICLKLNAGFKETDLNAMKTIKLSQITQGKMHTVPVWFSDSEDWDHVTSHSQLTKEKVIEQLLQIEFNVAMFGFLPGFVYMGGLPTNLQVPRKSVPAIKMDPNTLAIGGPYLGIYSLPSPGGWNAIGQIACNIFDVNQSPPILINQGDRFRFSAISHSAFLKIEAQQLSINQL